MHSRPLIYWLLSLLLGIYAIILIGGITRLTQSGLSMVDWKPFAGIIPPMDQQEWQARFQAYQKYPEYRLLRPHMTLYEYKEIFFWEYLHRIIGRGLGLLASIPLCIFLYRGIISWRHSWPYFLLIFWGGIQGLVGWYMVKSGLATTPHVSHYRLAIHLSLALSLLAATFWLMLKQFPKLRSQPSQRGLARLGYGLTALVSIQIIWGAFTAGLHAGKIFPTFPKMAGSWIPAAVYENFNLLSLSSRAVSVQLVHRYLGLTIAFYFLLLIGYAFLKQLNHWQKLALGFCATLIPLQIGLGILTLLGQVPTTLAISHQGCAVLLLLACIFLNYCTKSTTYGDMNLFQSQEAQLPYSAPDV